ncbi:MAG: hypothetical protein AAF618_13560 [Pseudomonadota bacterium]
MSDPVTNVEIEDVLSSIRRLVSQDPDAAAPRQAPKEADALVLTADHRVDGAEAPAEAAADDGPDGEGESDPEMTFVRREAASAVRTELERAIEELEASMGLAEAARSEDVAPEPPQAAERKDPQSLAEEIDALADELDWEAPVGRAMEGAPPAARVPEVEVLAPEETDTAAAVEAEPVPEPVSAQEASETQRRGGAASALEAIHLVSSQGDDAHDYEDEEDVAPNASARFTAPEPPYDPSKDDPFPSYGADGDVEKRLDREIAIDADLLRDMVSEIVREELQGALGERITRNVRKLVRREINRALAGQDLI